MVKKSNSHSPVTEVSKRPTLGNLVTSAHTKNEPCDNTLLNFAFSEDLRDFKIRLDEAIREAQKPRGERFKIVQSRIPCFSIERCKSLPIFSKSEPGKLELFWKIVPTEAWEGSRSITDYILLSNMILSLCDESDNRVGEVVFVRYSDTAESYTFAFEDRAEVYHVNGTSVEKVLYTEEGSDECCCR